MKNKKMSQSGLEIEGNVYKSENSNDIKEVDEDMPKSKKKKKSSPKRKAKKKKVKGYSKVRKGIKKLKKYRP